MAFVGESIEPGSVVHTDGWLAHQGAVSHEHLDSYLDEFAFRFNRRKSRSRGKLFYRLVQQAVAVPPAPYKSLVGGTATRATDDHNM